MMNMPHTLQAKSKLMLPMLCLTLIVVGTLPALGAGGASPGRMGMALTEYATARGTTAGSTVDAPYISGNYQIDAVHDGNQPMPFRLPLRKLWSAQFTGPNGADVEIPMIAHGMVFIPVNHPDQHDSSPGNVTLTALSETTGQVVWGPVQVTSGLSRGVLAYGDGRLYSEEYYDRPNTPGLLVAYDAASGDRSGR